MKKIFIISLLATALLTIGCKIYTNDVNNVLGLTKTKNIRYEIIGTTTSASITMSNSSNDTEQFSSATVPWHIEFPVELTNGSYHFAYLSAQNNKDSGSVITKIYVDGKLFKEAASSGAFVNATASGSVNY